MPASKKELVLASLVFLAIPVFCEVALRLVHYSAPPKLYMPDLGRGWKLRAGVAGWNAGETRQFVRINSHGFRDVERSYQKAPNTVRVAVLGNSWTEALQVPQEKTFCAVLEKRLSASPCYAGKEIEVLNFGVAGYSTAQEVLTLEQEVWKYDPDVVLLALYPARDIANNVRELNNAVNPAQSPYFVYRGGKLELDDSYRTLPVMQSREIWQENVRDTVNQHVRLLQAIDALQQAGRIHLAMAAMKEKAEKAGVDNLEFSIYAPPSDSSIEQGWKVTEGLLVMLRDEVKSHDTQFRLLLLPTRPQVLPDEQKREALLQKLQVRDFDYADKRLRNFCERENISVIELAPTLSAYATEHHVYLNGFDPSNIGTGHWNETGHRVAGEAIAVALSSEVKPEAAASLSQ
ncbi:MAG TPA: hypothetical protein VMH20_00235 [Verrucomicrobiae bacterium]|nr:hypothetical protein [Verrucomicrobiae bacterium]